MMTFSSQYREMTSKLYQSHASTPYNGTAFSTNRLARNHLFPLASIPVCRVQSSVLQVTRGIKQQGSSQRFRRNEKRPGQQPEGVVRWRCCMRLEARKYLYDIKQAADLLGEFTAGKQFTNENSMLRAAVERKFEIIGRVGTCNPAKSG